MRQMYDSDFIDSVLAPALLWLAVDQILFFLTVSVCIQNTGDSKSGCSFVLAHGVCVVCLPWHCLPACSVSFISSIPSEAVATYSTCIGGMFVCRHGYPVVISHLVVPSLTLHSVISHQMLTQRNYRKKKK